MDFSALRKKMVQEQLIGRGIKDRRLLAAFEKVPRDKFVSTDYLDSAYGDFPLPIGAGQTISQPYMVALMSESLGLKGPESVLEIGTGSGYQAAILAELVASVYSVERISSLAKSAEGTLSGLGYQNIKIKTADGTLGWPEHAPYEAIIVTAAAPDIPQALIEQLKINGTMVIPVGGNFTQILTVVTRHKDKIDAIQVCGCVFVPLLGKQGWSK